MVLKISIYTLALSRWPNTFQLCENHLKFYTILLLSLFKKGQSCLHAVTQLGSPVGGPHFYIISMTGLLLTLHNNF